jgi:serine/threonine protein kinase
VAPRIDPYSLVGTTLRERYTIVSFGGVGRYSIVYRAIEVESERGVALRFLKVRHNLTPSQRTVTVERLRALVQPMVEIAEHYPSLAEVIEVGALVTSEGRWMPAIVQPWLDGQSLESVLVQERQTSDVKRTLAGAIDLLTPVAEALQYAHIRGLIHGSVAPRNVFVRGMRASRSNFDADAPSEWTGVELLDLGMAYALAMMQSRDRAFVDSQEPLHFFAPAHGAPEQFTSAHGAVGPATDVFALALMVVELVTGKAPLGEGDDDQLAEASMDPVYRPTPRAFGVALGPYVEAVLERALAVRPSDRYATMASFWDALRAASRVLIRGSSSSILPPPLPMEPTEATETPPPMELAPLGIATTVDLESARASRISTLPTVLTMQSIPRMPVRTPVPPHEFFVVHGDEPMRPRAASINHVERVERTTNPLFEGDAGRSVAPTAMDAPTPTELADARSSAHLGSALALAASFLVGVAGATAGEQALRPTHARVTYTPLPADVLAAVAAIRPPTPPPIVPEAKAPEPPHADGARLAPALPPCKADAKRRGKHPKTCP